MDTKSLHQYRAPYCCDWLTSSVEAGGVHFSGVTRNTGAPGQISV